MCNVEKVERRKIQKVIKKIKKHEAERIALLEEKLKGLKLAHQTGLHTIPVKQVATDDLSGVSLQPWGNFWEHDKIDLRTPVILGREKNIIGGPMQYFTAKEEKSKQINAVYIDSLRGKIVSADTLREQFKDEQLCMSFAYCLYIAVSTSIQNIVSYSDFCQNFDRIFEQKNICWLIYDYISELDKAYGD